MAETESEVYLKLFQVLIIVVILSVIIYRKRQYQINALNWLIIIFSFTVLQGVVEIITYFVKINHYHLSDPKYFRFNEVHLVPYGITIFFIYLLSEAMVEIQPNPYRFALVVGLFASYNSVMFFQIYHNYDLVFDDKTAPHQPFNIIFDIYQLVAMSFTSYVFWKSYKYSRNKQNRRATFILFLAIFIFVLVTIYELIEQIFELKDIYGVWLYGTTFLVLAYVYLKYPYFVLGNPNKIYRIILSTNSGLLIYSVDLEKSKKSSSDELLAGGISAMSEFISETSGSTGPLNYVQFEDRALIVRRVNNLVGYVIAEKATRILWTALKQFVKEFTQVYIERKGQIHSKVDKFTIPEEQIIIRCFPFVEPHPIIESKLNTQISITE
ncbi:MAG: hypothetical protein ACXAD7_23180 [Candidatus Kariarchaeaceae archaeon]|jgi:hypothetical protein